MTEPYRCPTPCDEDCEINGWGCHEAHDVPSHREHDPGACEARMLAGNLRWLLDDARQEFELARASARADYLEPYRLQFRRSGTVTWRVMLGAGPGDALAKAVDWLRREGAGP